jgi:hypothetical protein
LRNDDGDTGGDNAGGAVGCFFQAGFQAVPFNSGGVLGWTSPSIEWGGFGSTSPSIEWGGFRALSLRGKTPPLNEGGAFQNAPPSTVGNLQLRRQTVDLAPGLALSSHVRGLWDVNSVTSARV